MRAYSAFELAAAANLLVAHRPDLAGVKIIPGALLLGAGVTDDEVATIAVRSALRSRGCDDEAATRAVVERLGYRYIPSQ